jgi:hypothetical protein
MHLHPVIRTFNLNFFLLFTPDLRSSAVESGKAVPTSPDNFLFLPNPAAHSLFLPNAHWSGQKYISIDAVQMLRRVAGALLSLPGRCVYRSIQQVAPRRWPGLFEGPNPTGQTLAAPPRPPPPPHPPTPARGDAEGEQQASTGAGPGTLYCPSILVFLSCIDQPTIEHARHR